MTKLLDEAFAAVRQQPAATQDEVARAMLSLLGESVPEPIDPSHLPAIAEGLAQLRRGEFASEQDLAAVLRSFEG